MDLDNEELEATKKLHNIEYLSEYEECRSIGDIVVKINEIIIALKYLDKRIDEVTKL